MPTRSRFFTRPVKGEVSSGIANGRVRRRTLNHWMANAALRVAKPEGYVKYPNHAPGSGCCSVPSLYYSLRVLGTLRVSLLWYSFFMHAAVEKIFKTGAVHHAYLMESRDKAAYLELSARIADLAGILMRGNPDFIVDRYDTFTIEDARRLSERITRKAVLGSDRYFILSVSTITSDAEHALLKTVEEPPEGTHLFLILPSRDDIISTLRSRFVYAGRLDSEAVNRCDNSAASFLKADLKSSLKEAEEVSKLERIEAGRFLDDVISAAASALSKRNTPVSARAMGELLKARRMITEGGVGLKQVLQYAALALSGGREGALSSREPRSRGRIEA